MSQYNLRKHLSTITPATTLSRFIGPIDRCGEAVWGLLTDFDNWPKWAKQVDSVERLDGGDPGRGSVLAVKGRGKAGQWRINHWHPGRRIDFIVETVNRRIAYSFTINDSGDTRQVELRLQMEFEFLGPGSLLSGLLNRFERGRGERLFKDFTGYMKSLETTQ